MVESTALEMRRTGNRTVGSNPTLSATSSAYCVNRVSGPGPCGRGSARSANAQEAGQGGASASALTDFASADFHSLTPRSRKELPITVTELSDIAAPAMIGDRRILNQG